MTNGAHEMFLELPETWSFKRFALRAASWEQTTSNSVVDPVRDCATVRTHIERGLQKLGLDKSQSAACCCDYARGAQVGAAACMIIVLNSV